MLAAYTATDKARAMAIVIGGPLAWNDTKESWRARLARKIASTPRRVRALLSNNEKLRLGADEYLAIQAAYERSTQAVAEAQDMAWDAALRRDRARRGTDALEEGEGRPAGPGQQPSALPPVRSA